MKSQFNYSMSCLNEIRNKKRKRKKVRLLNQLNRFNNSPKRKEDEPVEEDKIIKPPKRIKG